jgi:glycosyltransferase involved in cell wall biosynthesis
MRRRVVLITEIISPYRIPLFNALARQPEVDLRVIFLAETDPGLRQWQIYKDEIRFSYRVLPSWRQRVGKYNLLINRGVRRALRDASPHLIVCGGYNYFASWRALAWSRSYRVPFLLWSESNQQDLRRETWLVESLKNEFLHRCSAFIVPGQSARQYLRTHNVSDENIFTAPNAVDNDLFAAAAENARSQADALKRKLSLPGRYFLFVGRLVPEKGVFDLLDAYAKLDVQLRAQIGLVFVGDGSCRQKLEDRAAAISPGMIRFAGFAQRENLADYYAMAEALILPTYSDPWGLVVNEAMACRLPVIVSSVAGCAADLVKSSWNGWLLPPKDVPSLHAAMVRLVTQPDLSKNMGSNSGDHIAHFTPEIWAKSVEATVKTVASAHD